MRLWVSARNLVDGPLGSQEKTTHSRGLTGQRRESAFTKALRRGDPKDRARGTGSRRVRVMSIKRRKQASCAPPRTGGWAGRILSSDPLLRETGFLGWTSGLRGGFDLEFEEVAETL